MPKEAAFEVLESANIDQNARAETLSVNDLIRLSEKINNK
jgi:16S rRNA A1518/A1519 N6-dimethyltransferase RsmA/KsgA/DIM1 with predicted DNA glycosylase/AP lyase activity